MYWASLVLFIKHDLFSSVDNKFSVMNHLFRVPIEMLFVLFSCFQRGALKL